MPARSLKGPLRIVLVLLLGALFADPVGAAAVPSNPLDAPIAAKKAEEAAAKDRVTSLQADLTRQVTEYQSLIRRMDATRLEMSAVTTEIAQQEIELATVRQALADRAVQLYRADSNGMLEVLLTARSMQDLIARTEYVVLVGQRDADLMNQVRKTQAQTLFLQGQLADRFARLTKQQGDAEAQRKAIAAAIASQQQKTTQLGKDVASLVRQRDVMGAGVATPTTEFDENTVISDATFRDWTWTAVDIQAFLDGKPGALKSYRGTYHDGRTMSAAEMIAAASSEFKISPKVILATLQKEQSLIEAPSPSAKAMNGAMGAGMPDNPANTDSSMQGFGNQIYWGAQKFDKNANDWAPGVTESVDTGSAKHEVHPTTAGTFAQWRYTPHTTGVRSFWKLYWRYFGSPV